MMDTKIKGILGHLSRDVGGEEVGAGRALRRILSARGMRVTDLKPISYLTDDDLQFPLFMIVARKQTAEGELRDAEKTQQKARRVLLETARGYVRQIGGTTTDALIEQHMAPFQMIPSDREFNASTCEQALSVLDTSDEHDQILAAILTLRAESAKLGEQSMIEDVFSTEIPSPVSYWMSRFQMRCEIDDLIRQKNAVEVQTVIMRKTANSITEAIAAEINRKSKSIGDYVPHDVFVQAILQKTGSTTYYEEFCIATETTNEAMRLWRQTKRVPAEAFAKIATMVVPPRKSMASWTPKQIATVERLIAENHSYTTAAHTMTRQLGEGVSQSDIRTLVRVHKMKKGNASAVPAKAKTPRFGWTPEHNTFIIDKRTKEGLGPTDIHRELVKTFKVRITINAVKGRMNHLNVWNIKRHRKRADVAE